MISFYVIFILIPVIANAGDEFGPSYRSSITEGGKPILRGGEPDDAENVFSEDLSMELDQRKEQPGNQHMVRDLKLLLSWLVNNYGYEIVSHSRRQDAVSSTTAEHIIRSHHAKSKHMKKKKKTHKSKRHGGKKSKRNSHDKHSKKKKDKGKSSHSDNKHALRNADFGYSESLNVNNLNDLNVGTKDKNDAFKNQDVFENDFNTQSAFDKLDKPNQGQSILRNPYFDDDDDSDDIVHSPNFNNINLNDKNTNTDNLNYDEYISKNFNKSAYNDGNTDYNRNYNLNYHNYENLNLEDKKKDAADNESPFTFSNFKDFVYGVVHGKIPKLGNNMLRIVPDSSSINKAHNMTVAVYVNI